MVCSKLFRSFGRSSWTATHATLHRASRSGPLVDTFSGDVDGADGSQPGSCHRSRSWNKVIWAELGWEVNAVFFQLPNTNIGNRRICSIMRGCLQCLLHMVIHGLRWIGDKLTWSRSLGWEVNTIVIQARCVPNTNLTQRQESCKLAKKIAT